MSTATEARLRSARTRRMLEDTALTAAGGGVLLGLTEDHRTAGVWRADVRCADGRRLDVRLDPELQTVWLQPAEAPVAAAA